MSWSTNTIMTWNGQKVSDHARSPLDISYDVLERKTRMANGTMRKYVIARKMNISCSWEMLPSKSPAGGAGPVDGGMNGQTMLSFYNTQKEFTVVIRDGNGDTLTNKLFFISEFSYTVEKRAPKTDYWNVDITLEEV